MKASLFAAGCFCELADDFASVVLEMLVNMMASLETLPAVRLAGASVFTRMVCSYSVSSRAYKVLCISLSLSHVLKHIFQFEDVNVSFWLLCKSITRPPKDNFPEFLSMTISWNGTSFFRAFLTYYFAGDALNVK